VKLAVLNTRRPEVDLELLADYDALFRGGKTFAARLSTLLPQRPDEADKVYAFRLKTAHYLNYAGPIVSRFAAWLFTGRMEVKSEPANVDGYYAALREDCDGLGTDLSTMLRKQLTRALVQRRSWVLVDFPADAAEAPPETRADWDARGLGKGYLCPLDEVDVLDWEHDEAGELLYAVVKHRDQRRRSPGQGRGMITDTWTVWGRETWERYAVTYEVNKPPKDDDEVPRVAMGKVATKGHVPLVAVELPDELWAMNVLASPQTEQMRARNAESWGLQRTCFAMRIFKLLDREEPPVQGAGYGMVIGVGEDVEWDAPPAEAFTPIAHYADRLKDELHRVTSQMAYGVNNSAASVGRSADSKHQDNKLFDVILGELGRIVCEAAEKILDLVSLGRGDGVVWSVSGLSKFDIGDATELTTNAVTAQTLNIPSPTFRRMLSKRVAFALVPDASEQERAQISKEIDDNTPDELEAPEPEGDEGAAPALNGEAA
jgi:hypothetical protein